MKKRITGILTTLSIIITMFVPVSSVHAELGIKHELQVSLMAALNIVPGYPSSYNADETVSAVDFVSFAYRLAGVDLYDVSGEVKSYGLNEDSETIDPVSAVKIIFDVIGYDKIADMYGGDYYAMASALGITKNADINLKGSEPVTYDQMVMLFWNALNMDALTISGANSYRYSDKTIMEYYLKIYEGRGIVNANNTIAVDGGGTTGLGEVRIDNERYLTGNTMTEQLIGSNVQFYYYNGSDKILRWIETNNSGNNTISVYGNDIESASSSSIAYDDAGRNRTLKLDNNYLIIYNGKAVTDGTISIEAVMSLNARNYFIDNDNNGRYNIVTINDYEYYLVDAISSNTYIVNDYSAKTSVDLGNADRLTVYKNGMPANADVIKAGDVIAVAKSTDSSIISVEILSGTVSGEITALASAGITISGTKYNVSPSYAGDALKVGRNGTFYFDNYGRIVRCTGLKEGDSQYGYLLNFYQEANGDCYMELITAEGTRKTFTVKQSLNVNGEKCNLAAALQKVGKEQLITYKVGSENRITQVNIANQSYIGRDTTSKNFSIHFKGAGKYRKNNMCFNSKYLIDSTTPIFVVPISGDKHDYTMMDTGALVNNTTYDISVYDIDDYMYASCIVLKENFAEPENLRSKRSIVLTDIATSVNEDGELIILLEGYQQGGKVSYVAENTEMKDNRGRYYVKDLDEGDVIQVGLDMKNNIIAVQLLFKADEEKLAIAAGTENSNKYWEGGNMAMPDLSVSYGTMVDRNTNVLLVDADGNNSVLSKDPHKFGSSTNVYVYENGKVYPTNKNDIFNGDMVYIHEYQGNLQEVLVVR